MFSEFIGYLPTYLQYLLHTATTMFLLFQHRNILWLVAAANQVMSLLDSQSAVFKILKLSKQQITPTRLVISTYVLVN